MKRAFTLIELLIVVAIIGVLAAIAVPKFNDLITKSREGATKGNLNSLRGALNIYYGDNESLFPAGPAGSNTTFLQSAMVPRYLEKWPEVYVPGRHARTSSVDTIAGGDPAASDPTDDGEWVYVSNPDSVDWGRVNVECYHTDLRGAVWSSH
jgi:prepilin-type N-terminal cleavage/methylation domain-containing protein